ncbi:MAG: flavodoxin-dependent (E)-4-hydroxy-3-methylbut-2-enyl-diphosphate synthase [Clostridia bacterium]|nr:flavodoxin-dependent (E)-4-hydroxy-3-methylbut-2-enyl-diphosphate synthase [Clostridia bacterium]
MSKQIKIGTILVGGGAPVSIQSMTNTKTKDIPATVAQIKRLEQAGCEIVRLAVPDMESAECIDKIKEQTDLPLVADIHFDYRLALTCMERGIDKVRINPGNIGSMDRVKAAADLAGRKQIPIRIGVNGGSLEPALLKKYGRPCPEAMVESAMGHIRLLEQCGFDQIAVSLKSSTVADTVAAYRLMHQQSDYPLHVGVTEAGTAYGGIIKSAMGIGALLLDGIGDTIRVSLTADPVEEVRCAKELLKAAGLRREGVTVVSCPTCARCNIDLIPIAEQVTKAVEGCKKNLKIAVMGCAVNGPGEARDADLGLAGGKGCVLLFRKGEIIRKVPQEQAVAALLAELEQG